MYRYTGKWAADTVSDFVRVDKLVLFGDFLCGIDSPVLQYNVDREIYESVVERESSERRQDQQSTNSDSGLKDRSSSGSEPGCAQFGPMTEGFVSTSEPTDSEASADILALQRQRAKLQRQLEEEKRLIAWRRNAIRQAASGGFRAVELEVRPIYLLPDTNCYIDWLEGIATLAQRSSNYTVLVPIVVVNELDALARQVTKPFGNVLAEPLYADDTGEVTRAGLIQERARSAITYLEDQFAQRNSRLRALTAKGSFLETIAYRTEINGGRDPGQVNDDVILTCCTHFFKEDPDLFRTNRLDGNAQPIRIFREIVLLTSDRNLRLKAVNINLPARPLRTFVNWSRLPLVTQIPKPATEPGLSRTERKNEFPKLQPRGQWKQPLKH